MAAAGAPGRLAGERPYDPWVPHADDLAILRGALARLDPGSGPPGEALAGVLVPLVPGSSGLEVVFTRRTDHLPRHRGEISFPGGRAGEREDPRDCALREAEEELGIDARRVEVLGPLPRRSTRVSGFTLCPWVAVLPSAEFGPNPAEIAEVIVVALDALRAAGVRREQRIVRAGGLIRSPAFDAGEHVIWGATARVLADLLDLLARGSHAPAGLRREA